METAKNAVESIDGLRGYVGVDMILDDERIRYMLLRLTLELQLHMLHLESY